MAKFTLHNESGDFLEDSARTLQSAIKKCDLYKYNVKVYETYFAPSPFNKNKITEHGKEVYKNFK